jgi:hypothetical protein
VLGEPFRDVSPGYLPRSLNELRNISSSTPAPFIQSLDATAQSHNIHEETTQSASLEDTLDQMMEQAETDAHPQPALPLRSPQTSNALHREPGSAHAATPNAQRQARRVAALRRELNRMRNGIERVVSGLRNLGEEVDSNQPDPSLQLSRRLDEIDTGERPNTSSAQNASSRQEHTATNANNMYTHTHGPMANLQVRLDRANMRLEEARRAREQAADDLEASESEVQASRELVRSLEREQRTAENYVRIFGTREEMERAGADYESPVGGMFTRAENRYRVAEAVRREQRDIIEALEGEERVLEVEGPPQAQTDPLAAEESEVATNVLDQGGLSEYYTTLRRQDSTQGSLSSLRTVLEATRRARTLSGSIRERIAQAAQQQDHREESIRVYGAAEPDQWLPLRRTNAIFIRSQSSGSEDDGQLGLDRDDDGRPGPKNDEEMTVKLDCKICYQQLADTIVLPCAHLVMCEWCAAQHVPSHGSDRTRPKRPADCPLCRKRIKQKVGDGYMCTCCRPVCKSFDAFSRSRFTDRSRNSTYASKVRQLVVDAARKFRDPRISAPA